MKKRIIFIAIIVVVVFLIAIVLSKCGGKPKEGVSDLSFVIPDGGIVVDRDYNQQRLVGIRNEGTEAIGVRLFAEGPPEIPSGFVGRGTSDWETPDMRLTIAPGETWDVPLLVHADRAALDEITLLLKATAGKDDEVVASREVSVNIESPKLELETTWLEVSDASMRARLGRTLRIRNTGTPVSDLTMHFENPSGKGWVIFEPGLEYTRLGSDEEIEILVRPKLHPWFTGIDGNIVLSGLNQTVEIPYSTEVGEGDEVFVTLSRSTGYASNTGSRCTNRKSVSYGLSPVGGTPGPNSEPPEEVEFGGQPGSMGGVSGGSVRTDPWPDDWEESWESESEGEANKETGESNLASSSDDRETDNASEEYGKKDGGKRAIIIDLPLGEDELPAGPEYHRSLPTTDLLDANSEGLLTDQLAAVLDFDDFEALTYLDAKGRKTHVVSEADSDNSGARLLNFSFGIEPGRRVRVPVRLGYSVSSLSLGPSPMTDEGAAAVYTRENDKGEVVIELLDPFSGKSAVLGTGETPKLTADGIVYVDQGKLRRSRVGSELLASTDDEWGLNGVESGPILGLTKDAENQSWLLTKEGDYKIALRGEDGTIRELRGSDASIQMAAGAPIIAIQRSDGSIDLVGDGDSVTNLVPASSNIISSRLFATDAGGLRLFVQKRLPDSSASESMGLAAGGAFAFEFKDGEWSGAKRVFQIQPSVERTAVAVNFDAPFGSAHYKPMNIKVHLNDYEVGRLKAKVPSGRFVFHAPPSKLFYESPGSLAQGITNRIRIDSEGIGAGNFHLTDHCSIYTKHEFVEECLVASSAEEAERLAQFSTPLIRHRKADLMVTSNGWEIPRNAKPGQRVQLQVGLFNSGDIPASSGDLIASVMGETVGETTRPEVEPFHGRVVPIEVILPDDWNPEKSLSVRVIAALPGDVNPSDNALDFDLFRELQPQIAGSVSPVQFDLDSINPVVIPDSAGEPSEIELSREGLWYQTAIPPSGELQVEVDGRGADLIDRMDLYDENGKFLPPDRGEWSTETRVLNLRVGLPPETSLPPGTFLRLWWE